jgi:limonene-1,2-epoxide hydrolase
MSLKIVEKSADRKARLTQEKLDAALTKRVEVNNVHYTVCGLYKTIYKKIRWR